MTRSTKFKRNNEKGLRDCIKKLRLIIKEKDMHYKDLADKAGLSQTAVYFIVKNATEIRLGTLLAILKALDVDVKDFFASEK